MKKDSGVRNLILLPRNLVVCNNRSGFTLLEVFIAMAIFALVAVSVMRSLGTLLSNTAIISDDMRASLELNNAFTEPLIQAQQPKPEIKPTKNISVGQLPAEIQKSINAPMIMIRAAVKLSNDTQLQREVLIPALPKDKS